MGNPAYIKLSIPVVTDEVFHVDVKHDVANDYELLVSAHLFVPITAKVNMKKDLRFAELEVAVAHAQAVSITYNHNEQAGAFNEKVHVQLFKGIVADLVLNMDYNLVNDDKFIIFGLTAKPLPQCTVELHLKTEDKKVETRALVKLATLELIDLNFKTEVIFGQVLPVMIQHFFDYRFQMGTLVAGQVAAVLDLQNNK